MEVAIKTIGENSRPTLSLKNGLLNDWGPSPASIRFRTDTKGTFKLPIINEHFCCLIFHETGYLIIDDVDLTNQKQLRLKPWSTVEGTAYHEGKPSAGVTVRGLYSGGVDLIQYGEVPAFKIHQEIKTDQAGNFKLLKGIPGKWVLVADRGSVLEMDPESGKMQYSKNQKSVTVKLTEGEHLQQDIGRDEEPAIP